MPVTLLVVGVFAAGAIALYGQENTAPTGEQASVSSGHQLGFVIGNGWNYAFLIGLGLGTSLAAFVYAAKRRNDPFALAQAVAGGGLASTLASVLTTKVVDTRWEWSDAAVFAGFWFILGFFLWLCLLLAFVQVVVVGQIKIRYGRVQGMRAWLEFFEGVEPLRQWISQAISSLNAEREWDEFAMAAVQIHREFGQLENDIDLLFDVLDTVADREGTAPTLDDFMDITREALRAPVEALLAGLSQTTLNFTVWRVCDMSDNSLIHLASFPSPSGPSSGQARRKPFDIWSKGGRASAGSLAGHVLLNRQYTVRDASNFPDDWDRRDLGRSYDAVAAMPIPCDGDASPAWGVLCVEVREGTLGLSSHTMRELVALIARMVDRARRQYQETAGVQVRAVGREGLTWIEPPNADPAGDPETPTDGDANQTLKPNPKTPGEAGPLPQSPGDPGGSTGDPPGPSTTPNGASSTDHGNDQDSESRKTSGSKALPEAG